MACFQNGMALQYASESLRCDKEVVMAAVESKPESLKYALDGLNQDKNCLIKAGLWDKDHEESQRISTTGNDQSTQTSKKKVVLSTKFSLAAKSSPHATTFTVALKGHPYIRKGNFLVYSPNAFNKDTCDPDRTWTDKDWPCRGTFSSCQKPPNLKTGVPLETECCWRYSFRWQLREASRSGGFMVQVVDWSYRCAAHSMGEGQTIETEMAQAEGVKIFRFFEPFHVFFDLKCSSGDSHAKKVLYEWKVDELVTEIKKWRDNGCIDMEMCNVLDR